MNRQFFTKITALAALIAVLALALAACPSPTGDAGSTNEVKITELKFSSVVKPGETGNIAGSFSAETPHESGIFTAAEAVLSPYAIAVYETTWGQWTTVKAWAAAYTFANNGTEGHGTTGTGTQDNAGNRPVTGISWRDAVIWCNAASERAGLEPVYRDSDGAVIKDAANADGAVLDLSKNGFRLPTEAEWEYAARDGTAEGTAGSGAVGDRAWHKANAYTPGPDDAAYGAHPVGMKTANSFGLYDMSGNVWELVWDRWGGNGASGPDPTGPAAGDTLRVTRGGGWKNSDAACTAGSRNNMASDAASNQIGFRVARTLK